MSGPLTNWAGNVTFTAGRVARPADVAQLRALVAGADRLRVLGSGHSFNRIADAALLVSVADLPPTLEIDRDRHQARVAAGVRYGELAVRLHDAGYALPGMASLPHITVAGAVATGTHGSGDRVGGLATAVAGLELVTGDGELQTLTRRDGDRFLGAVVGLGALGVVTHLTLDLVPSYDIAQRVYDGLPWASLTDRFDEIFASAYSVSVFTDWGSPRWAQVWCKQRVQGDRAEDEPAGPPRDGWGATVADGPRHPVPGHTPEHCTEQLGVPGPWHTRLPHFRLEFTPSSGQELQSEYLLARTDAPAALAALDGIADRIAPVLQISELRTVAADELWLSPSYRRDSLAVHFTWVAETEAVVPVIAAVERALAPFAPRPHWGKLFDTPPDHVRQLYPRLGDFLRLATEMDPTHTFRNRWVSHHLPG